MSIFTLPVELIDSILGFLSTEDVCSLRLTCRKLNLYVIPILFRTLHLQFHTIRDCKLITAMSRDAGVEDSVIDIAPYVRHLVLESPPRENFKSDPPTPCYDFIALFDSEEGVDHEQEEVVPEAVVAKVASKLKLVPEVVVAQHLASFVGRLQNLQSLRWEYRSAYLRNPDEYVRNVMEVFSTLPDLKEVSIQLRHDLPEHPLPNLSAFKNLDSLHVSHDRYHFRGGEPSFAKYIKSDIIPAVAASPKLRSLHLASTEGRHASNNFTDLEEAVAGLWDREMLSIQDLVLSGIPLRTNVEFSSAFQNLRHLTLSHIDSDDISSTLTGIAWEQVWDTLYDMGTHHGVWLESLTTEGIQPVSGRTALFRYLKSHPGLKALTLCRPPFDIHFDHCLSMFDESQAAAYSAGKFDAENLINSKFGNEFWSIIVPRFAHSITELNVASLMEGPWCYGPTASEALRQCTGLRKLAISVSAVDKDWATKKAANIAISNIKPSTKPRTFGPGWGEENEDTYIEDEDEHTGGELRPVMWGVLESSPILVALDMGELPLLEAVSLTLAERDQYWGWGGRSRWKTQMIKSHTRQTLSRFIPWEGYPHIITGRDSIIVFEPLL